MPIIDRATHIFQKNSIGFADPDYFGTTPSLITPIKNMGTSNLEEELLLGNNFVKYTWEEDTEYGKMQRVQKEFRTSAQTDGYYFTLDSKPEDVIADNSMAYFSANFMSLPDGTFEDSTYSLKLNNDEQSKDYSYDFDDTTLVISTDKTDFNQFIEQISLWYKPEGAVDDNDDLLIATLNIGPEGKKGDKTVQTQQVINYFGKGESPNQYPKRTEVKSGWQII